jgi:hypothetical protein
VVAPDEFLVIQAGSRDAGSLELFVHGVTRDGRLKPAASEPGLTYQPLGGPPLTLYKSGRLPEIAGQPLRLPPPVTYASPFLQSQNGTAVLARAPGGDELVIDLYSRN